MIRIENLQKSYDGKPVLDHFSLTLPDSGIVCLTGASGRGKTTLLRILAGLEPADGGSITGLGGRKIAFVFQEDRLLPWITAEQNIRLAQPHSAKCEVRDLLAQAGLEPADCKTAFVTAAAWMALAAMEADGGAVESFTAGDLTIRGTGSAQRSRELRAQAERVMDPYLVDGGFCFRGVRG